MIASPDFPRLTAANHRITSPSTPDYNCVAWSIGDTEHWWQPGVFWPIAGPKVEFGIAALAEAMKSQEFAVCETGAPEFGFEKVALYATSAFYTHASRQLPNGKWTSKLCRMEDIEHDSPDDLADGVYGSVVLFMKRKVAS
ncbi:MAG: DUF7689 domain-containing protein [Pirellulaceae bacterium]